MQNDKSQQGVARIAILLVGIALGIGVMYWLGGPSSSNESQKSGDKPLYWVAPMDPNYKRDQPGLSPMGMELIPVYSETTQGVLGEVIISPQVINNLGVRTAKVAREALARPIRAFGELQYDEERLIHIHPRLSGWVEKLYVKAAGERVEKNAPLYALYSPELVSAQEELLLAMGRQNTRLVNAAVERLKALQIPEDFIARLKKTQTIQQTVTFYTPQTGVVDKLNIREGFFVQPGTTMLSIASLASIWVESEVFANQAPFVEIGMPVSMAIDFLPSQIWRGKVDYIYPSINADHRTLRIRSRFENNENQLKPGMFAELTLHARPSNPVLVVPRDALIRLEHQTRAVLSLGEGRFKSIAVNTGATNGELIEITEGLEEGDDVVISAQFLLDSESSKTSDFLRLQPLANEYPWAEVIGVINSIDESNRTANISREAIDKWNRGPATMDFQFSDPINIRQFKPSDNVTFIFEVRDDALVILDIQKISNQPVREAAHSQEHNHAEVTK